jgi:drug/metabolite transporter (DMT)-like permease
MTALADDTQVAPVGHDARPRVALGVGLTLLSAVCFGMSGAMARGLLDTGWTPGAATLVRVTLAALVVAPIGVGALRGHWSALRANLPMVVLFGIVAVAGSQLCYFSAVEHMQVGPALLIEYTSPAVVVGWMWLRRGQRPSRLTLAGTGFAALGLVCVLDVLGGVGVSPIGVAWALAGMVGVATYFVICGDDRTGIPPMALAGVGLVIGAAALWLVAAVGLLPLEFSADPAVYSGHEVPFWLPAGALGLVSGALAYSAGIAGARHLGSRLAAFVALTEVLAAIVAAWLVVGETPRPIQLLGGLFVVVGVVVVRLGETGSRAAQAAESPTAEQVALLAPDD